MKTTHALRTRSFAKVFLAVVSLTFFSVSVFTPKMHNALFGIAKNVYIIVSTTSSLRLVLISNSFVSLVLTGSGLFKRTYITTQWKPCNLSGFNWAGSNWALSS